MIEAFWIGIDFKVLFDFLSVIFLDLGHLEKNFKETNSISGLKLSREKVSLLGNLVKREFLPKLYLSFTCYMIWECRIYEVTNVYT